MKHFSLTLAAAALLIVGCADPAPETPDSGAEVTPASLELCGKCGELKGGEACCAEGAEVCGCGLHKGSPGCCKMTAGEDVTLCSDCGHIKGGEDCCAEDGEVCSGCSWHKGSPACCKIDNPAAVDDEGEEESAEEEEGDAEAEGDE